MATRKSLVIVSGLFQELNTSADKLDLGGNSSTDIPEGTNLYYTNARARGAVSVTDSGGLGSLAYNSSTGAITYTGPSNSDVTGLISVASGSGLTYSGGEIGTSSIPNSQLANSSLTVGSTSINLGATAATIAGLTSLTATTLYAGAADAANSVSIGSTGLVFEGSTADGYETTINVVDATADRAINFPNAAGTVALLTSLSVSAGSGLTYNSSTGAFGTSSIPNAQLANSSVTIGSTSVAFGGTASTLSHIHI